MENHTNVDKQGWVFHIFGKNREKFCRMLWENLWKVWITICRLVYTPKIM